MRRFSEAHWPTSLREFEMFFVAVFAVSAKEDSSAHARRVVCLHTIDHALLRVDEGS